MLDGRRTVAEVWRQCNEQLGDAAPTQGEAIQLLGQLYTSNLLQAELPPDAEGLFRRYQKRVQREVQGYLTNILFIHIPLLDPDRFLDRWVGVLGQAFSWAGFAVWLVLLAVGGYFAINHFDELVSQGSALFSQQNLVKNLPLMYLCYAFIKLFHEFAHAFSCKKFGRDSGSGGEVHVMGLMFLVFMPLPYVDTSSSWAFRRSGHRAIVCAAGILVELAIASIAVIVWANTGQPLIRALAYNVIFLASVSTILFNGNPLLRYDGYYILSDVLQIPNLWHRSRQYLYYLVRKHVWRVRHPINPAHTPGEKAWMIGYGVASTIYRFFIVFRILLFVADKVFFVGAIMAVMSLVGWIFVPLGRFVHYLTTSGELARVRGRAIASVVAAAAIVTVGIGLISAPDRVRLEGVVEPVALSFVHARTDGFVEKVVAPSGKQVHTGEVLLEATNRQHLAERAQLLAEQERFAALRRMAQNKEDNAAVQAYDKQISALSDRLAWVGQQLEELILRAPISGEWVSPDVEHFEGMYLPRGQKVGLVVSPEKLIIRAVAGQDVSGILRKEIDLRAGPQRVEMRVKGRPDLIFTGTIQEIYPAGTKQLPSAALAYLTGGSVLTDPGDPNALQAAEPIVEVRVAPDPSEGVPLLSGQRVAVRLDLPSKPLAVQWFRQLSQMVQGRFGF